MENGLLRKERYTRFFIECTKHRKPCLVELEGLELFKWDDGGLVLHLRTSNSSTIPKVEEILSQFGPRHNFSVTPIVGNDYKRNGQFVANAYARCETRTKRDSRSSKNLAESRSESRSRSREKSSRAVKREYRTKNRAAKMEQVNIQQRLEYLERFTQRIHLNQKRQDQRATLSSQRLDTFDEKIDAYGEEIELCKSELNTHSQQIRLCNRKIDTTRVTVEDLRKRAREHRAVIAKQEEELRTMQEDMLTSYTKDEEEAELFNQDILPTFKNRIEEEKNSDNGSVCESVEERWKLEIGQKQEEMNAGEEKDSLDAKRDSFFGTLFPTLVPNAKKGKDLEIRLTRSDLLRSSGSS